MDLTLDYKKGRGFNCDECLPNLQTLRNCSGTGKLAKNLVNNKVYGRCPRAISIESHEARYLVNLYWECRENKVYPYTVGAAEQTAFLMDVFNQLDELTSKYKEKMHEDQMKKMKSDQVKTKGS